MPWISGVHCLCPASSPSRKVAFREVLSHSLRNVIAIRAHAYLLKITTLFSAKWSVYGSFDMEPVEPFLNKWKAAKSVCKFRTLVEDSTSLERFISYA